MRVHSKPGETKSCTGIFHLLTMSFVMGKIWKKKLFLEQYLSALNIEGNCIFWKRPVAPETTREKSYFSQTFLIPLRTSFNLIIRNLQRKELT